MIADHNDDCCKPLAEHVLTLYTGRIHYGVLMLSVVKHLTRLHGFPEPATE